MKYYVLCSLPPLSGSKDDDYHNYDDNHDDDNNNGNDYGGNRNHHYGVDDQDKIVSHRQLMPMEKISESFHWTRRYD